MARMAAALLLAVLAVSPAAAARQEVTPTQKVIQLLDGMIAKGKKEKHSEQVQFAAYKQFCDDTSGAKQKSIKEANEMIEVLKADIEKYTIEAADLAQEIATTEEDIATWEGDLKASTKVREIENQGYLLTHKDYEESIQAIDDGIATLKKQAHDVAQAGSALLQIANHKAPLFPMRARQVIRAFLAQDWDTADDGENLAVANGEAAPEAAAFEFQSQGIVDMLTELQSKFVKELKELEDMESNAKNAYAMIQQDLTQQITNAKRARDEKVEEKGKAQEAAASATGGLEDTTTVRDDDTKYLADLTSTCDAKSAAFAERQTLRAEEIEAIQKAKEILESGAVSGAADKHLPALVQKQKTTSFAQLRADSTPQLRVAEFLRDEAGRIDSRILRAISTRVSADPMAKVKKMIKDLIYKLMEEANAEAEAKGFCDKEMNTNAQTRAEKTEGVEMLTAEIAELEADIAKLTEENAELTAAVAATEAAVAKATTIRESEKIKNAATVKDAQEAQTAVAQALSVLKDFYDKAEKATSLVQQQHKQPEIFDDEPYKGMGAENGGVVGMIEVIQSDFARLESETTSAEAEGQKEYEQFMNDSEIDKAAKNSDIEHKSSKKQNEEKRLSEAKADLDGTSKELAAAMAYWEKLKPSCVDEVESYEDRVARRKEEIESLQEALKILTAS